MHRDVHGRSPRSHQDRQPNPASVSRGCSGSPVDHLLIHAQTVSGRAVDRGGRRPGGDQPSPASASRPGGGSAPCGRRRIAPDFNPGCGGPNPFLSPFRGNGMGARAECPWRCGRWRAGVPPAHAYAPEGARKQFGPCNPGFKSGAMSRRPQGALPPSPHCVTLGKTARVRPPHPRWKNARSCSRISSKFRLLNSVRYSAVNVWPRRFCSSGSSWA